MAAWLGAALLAVSCSKRSTDSSDLTRTRPLQLTVGPVDGIAQVTEALDVLRKLPTGATDFGLPNQASLQVRPPVAEYNLNLSRLLEGDSLDASAEPDAAFLYLVETALKPVMVLELRVVEGNKIKTHGLGGETFTKNFAREYGVSWGNAQYATESNLPAGPYEIRFLVCNDLDNFDGIWFKPKAGATDFICSLTETRWGLVAGKLYSGAEFRAKLAESIKGQAATGPNVIRENSGSADAP